MKPQFRRSVKCNLLARPLAWPGLRLAARIRLTVRYWVPQPSLDQGPVWPPHGQAGLFIAGSPARVVGLFHAVNRSGHPYQSSDGGGSGDRFGKVAGSRVLLNVRQEFQERASRVPPSQTRLQMVRSLL